MSPQERREQQQAKSLQVPHARALIDPDVVVKTWGGQLVGHPGEYLLDTDRFASPQDEADFWYHHNMQVINYVDGNFRLTAHQLQLIRDQGADPYRRSEKYEHVPAPGPRFRNGTHYVYDEGTVDHSTLNDGDRVIELDWLYEWYHFGNDLSWGFRYHEHNPLDAGVCVCGGAVYSIGRCDVTTCKCE